MRIGPLVPAAELVSIENRLVRDLAWSVTIGPIVHPVSPRPIAPRAIATQLAALGTPGEPLPLFSSADRWLDNGFTLDWWGQFKDHLDDLDRDPAPLERWMTGTERLRHGLRYERFLSYFLEWHPQVDLLVHDLPVQGAERTLGQFDFIVRIGGVVTHLEVAIKYYLRLGKPWESARCLGTDLSDRMDRKIAHALSRQLALSAGEAGAQTLREAGLPHPRARRFSLRGLLFDRLSLLEAPPAAGTAAVGGEGAIPQYWLATRRELAAREWAQGLRWAVAGRGEWFSPVRAVEVEAVSLEELLEEPVDGVPRLVPGLTETHEATRGILLDRDY